MLKLENAGGGTVKVYVNGKAAPAVNIKMLECDISDLVCEGRNNIRIEVTSTLLNRMLSRGYDKLNSRFDLETPTVQSYGILGQVRILPYRDIQL